MKLALLADIHEDVEHLRLALRRLTDEEVDHLVVVGDIFETGERIEETCQVLAAAGAIGVWGNHDFGLCRDVDVGTRNAYPSAVGEFMASLRPRLVLDDCLVTHVEPWLNAEQLADLWYFDGPPDEPWKVERIFSAAPQRIMFAGHYHRWLLATPGGLTNWDGNCPVSLQAGRWFIVIGAICHGRYAVYDTARCQLTPFNDP